MLAAGATVIVHRLFEAANVVDEIERSRVTTVWLAPAMVNAIMALPDIERRDLSSVRVIINGGEKMPIPLIERIQRTFPSAWFADTYGLTETVSGDTFWTATASCANSAASVDPASMSSWTSGMRTGNSLPAGDRGEVVLRGPKIFKGYWRDPESTEAAFAGGWFHTGDIGVRDDDGYLFIVDRLKDMILSGGENVAGSEVERVLYEHQAVLETAVVGRPDERWGEVPVAFVALRPGVERDARGAHGALPRSARPVQGAQGCPVRRRPSQEPLGQGAQTRTPRPGLIDDPSTAKGCTVIAQRRPR